MTATSKLARLCALLGGASAAALIASSAYAQDAAGATEVEEIVVTATGREAAIQDVPIPITAVTGETIENADITDVRGLQQVAPAFRFFTGQSAAAGTTAYIRGIGTGGDNPGFESAVGFFIDGVYRNRSGTALSDLPEVERIEVLRGPQGTLFGRNTSAGAISVTTRGPSHEFGGYGEVTFGNYDRRRGVFGVTGPVSDALALRLDGGMETREGYITDVTSDRDINNRDRWFLRGQARMDFTDDLSLRLIADVSRADEECCLAVTIKEGRTAGAIDLIAGMRGLGDGILTPNPEEREATVSPNRNFREQVEDQGISGEFDWNLGDISVTSITAFRDWSAVRNQDIDFSAIDRAYRDGQEVGFETFTQEFRAQGDLGILDWLVGVFYADENLMVTDRIRVGEDAALYVDALAMGSDIAPTDPDFGTNLTIFRSLGAGAGDLFTFALTPALTQQFVNAGLDLATAQATAGAIAGAYSAAVRATLPAPGQGQVADAFQTDTKSLAVFTHNELSFTDALTLTLGLRWNHEEKDMTANLDSNITTCAALQSTTPIGASPVTPAALTAALLATPLATFPLLLCNPVLNTAAEGSFADSREENEWSGTASLSYKLNDDVMVYGGYSRGYKAGGYNLDRSGFTLSPASSTPPPASSSSFEPEFTDAYELGAKTTLLGGSTTLNLNAFYQEVSDYQLNAFSGFNFITQNVEKVVSKGVELDLMARASDYLTVQAGVLYLDAYYDSTATFGTNTITPGTRLAGSADWTVTTAVTYKQPISDELAFLAFVDGRYQTETTTMTLGRDPITDNDAFGIVNARVGIGRQDERWSVELYVRNAFDQYYNMAGFTVPEQDNIAVYPSEPRTFGISLRSEF